MGPAIFLAYFLLFGFLSIKHVSYALLALISMFAWEQLGALYIPFVAANPTIANILVLGLVVLGWFRLPAGTTFEFLIYPIRMALMLLLFYTVMSTVWAPGEVQSATRFMGQAPYLIVMLFIAPLLIRKSEDVTKLLDSLTIFGGILVVFFAYIPDFSGRALVVGDNLEEAVSLPLTLADFAATVFVVAIIRMKSNPVNIAWALFVCGSAVFLMTKTGSRGQLFFSLATVLICLPVRWKQFTVNKFFIYGMLAIAVTVSFLIVKNTENTLSERMQNITEDGGTETRIRLLAGLINSWADGSLMTIVFGLGSSASWSPSIAGFYPHNMPGEVLGELGLAGFCLLLFIISTLCVKAYSRELRANISNQVACDFAALFGCWMLAFLVSNKQGAWIDASSFILFAVLAEKCIRVGQRNYKHRVRRRTHMMKRSRKPR